MKEIIIYLLKEDIISLLNEKCLLCCCAMPRMASHHLNSVGRLDHRDIWRFFIRHPVEKSHQHLGEIISFHSHAKYTDYPHMRRSSSSRRKCQCLSILLYVIERRSSEGAMKAADACSHLSGR